MEYTKGYVAFIDILGFSNLVSNVESAEQVKKLFEFVEKFRYFYNTSPELNVKVAFFSDSIVLTTDNQENFTMLLSAIWVAESFLKENTKLYFRGGISKGLYYNEAGVAFGPAIVNSYKLENKAIYSRIIIDDEIAVNYDEDDFLIIKDSDGKYCFNPFSIGLLRNTSELNKEELTKSMEEEREILIDTILENFYTDFIDKYLWRIKPFNKMCDLLPKICEEYNYSFDSADMQRWKNLRISLKEIEDKSKRIVK